MLVTEFRDCRFELSFEVTEESEVSDYYSEIF